MNDSWLFQIRIAVSDALAATLRDDPAATSYVSLGDVLRRHDASLKCQFDAFAGYVSEAEQLGTEKYPLYQWTKQTVDNPAKKAKYLRSFTVYVGGDEVYSGEAAEQLRAELSALVGDAGIESVVKIDTNPANNPQPPARAS